MPEVDFWLFLALQVVALVGGSLTAAVSLAIGGLGGIKMLRTDLQAVIGALEQVDKRITREVKTRAGEKGAAAARDRTEAEIRAEAAERLAQEPGPGRQGQRPSVVR